MKKADLLHSVFSFIFMVIYISHFISPLDIPRPIQKETEVEIYSSPSITTLPMSSTLFGTPSSTRTIRAQRDLSPLPPLPISKTQLKTSLKDLVYLKPIRKLLTLANSNGSQLLLPNTSMKDLQKEKIRSSLNLTSTSTTQSPDKELPRLPIELFT